VIYPIFDCYAELLYTLIDKKGIIIQQSGIVSLVVIVGAHLENSSGCCKDSSSVMVIFLAASELWTLNIQYQSSYINSLNRRYEDCWIHLGPRLQFHE
jgi:hypothetical protein